MKENEIESEVRELEERERKWNEIEVSESGMRERRREKVK